MLWARACQSSTAFAFSAPRTSRRTRPRLRAWGVDEFGRGGALLVDRPGLVRPHAKPPFGQRGRIARTGRVRIAVRARCGRRRIDGDAGFGEPLDVVELGEAAVGEVLARTAAIGGEERVVHRAQSAHVRAGGLDVDGRDQPGRGVGHDLRVVGRPPAAVRHLHYPRLRIGGGGADLVRGGRLPRVAGAAAPRTAAVLRVGPAPAPLADPLAGAPLARPRAGGAPGLQPLGCGDRRLHAGLTLRRRPHLRGAGAALGATRIGQGLPRQPRHHRRRLAAGLERRPAAERGGARARAHPHPDPAPPGRGAPPPPQAAPRGRPPAAAPAASRDRRGSPPASCGSRSPRRRATDRRRARRRAGPAPARFPPRPPSRRARAPSRPADRRADDPGPPPPTGSHRRAPRGPAARRSPTPSAPDDRPARARRGSAPEARPGADPPAADAAARHAQPSQPALRAATRTAHPPRPSRHPREIVLMTTLPHFRSRDSRRLIRRL